MRNCGQPYSDYRLKCSNISILCLQRDYGVSLSQTSLILESMNRSVAALKMFPWLLVFKIVLYN